MCRNSYSGVASSVLAQKVTKERRRPKFSLFVPQEYKDLANKCWGADLESRWACPMDSATSSSGKRQPQGTRRILASSWGESAAGGSTLRSGGTMRALHQDLSSSAMLWEAAPQPKIKELHEVLRKKGAPCLSGFSIQVSTTACKFSVWHLRSDVKMF